MGTPEMQPGEPAVGIAYGYDQPSNPSYQPQDGGYTTPPTGVQYSHNGEFPGQVDNYPPAYMSHSTPPPGYAPHQPGYAPPQPEYAPSHQPGYAPSPQPGYATSNQPGYAPSPQPGYATSNQPGYAPSPQPGYATSNQPGYAPSPQPGYATSNQPGYAPFHQPGYAPSQAGFGPPGADGDPAYQFRAPGSPAPANYTTPATALTVYNAPPSPQNPMHRNPFHAGFIPSNAIYVSPVGIRLRDTFFGDTPAPFECKFCRNSGLTTVRSERSVASYIACMTAACIGVCFLLPQFDCLWHKFHYCPNCSQKVGDYTKADACLVVNPEQWHRPSFGVPA